MEHELYRGLAQRIRIIAEKADPFTRQRLLDLAYDGKGGQASWPSAAERPIPARRTMPPPSTSPTRRSLKGRSKVGPGTYALLI